MEDSFSSIILDPDTLVAYKETDSDNLSVLSQHTKRSDRSATVVGKCGDSGGETLSAGLGNSSFRTLPTFVPDSVIGGEGSIDGSTRSGFSEGGGTTRSDPTASPSRKRSSFLARRVVKSCGLDGRDTFSGLVDAVTGEPIQGRRTYGSTGEVYEGRFRSGWMRHGDGAVSKGLDGCKFLGR